MAGILDFLNQNPEQGRSLLAAAAQMLQQSGPSRTPQGLGQIIGGGVNAYYDSQDQQRTRGQQEQLRGLQIKGAESDLLSQQRAMEKAQAVSAAAKGAYRTAGERASSLPGGPTNANLARVGEFQDGFDENAYGNALMAIDPLMAYQFQQQQKKAAPELAGVDVATQNGIPVRVLRFKDGTEKVSAFDPQADMTEMNLGGVTQWVDKNRLQNGQKFQRTMTPDGAASNAVARANLGISRERLTMDRQNQARPTYNAEAGGFIVPPTAANPRGAIIPLQGARGPKLTEDQGKATSWVVQAENAWKNMQSVAYGQDGKLTDAAKPGFGDAVAALPFGIGESSGNYFRSADRQKFMQGSSSLSEALLRAATGAGVNRDEAIQKTREITPVWGDTPEVIAQKMDGIPLYLDSLKVRAGPGGALANQVLEKHAAQTTSVITPAPAASGGWSIRKVQ